MMPNSLVGNDFDTMENLNEIDPDANYINDAFPSLNSCAQSKYTSVEDFNGIISGPKPILSFISYNVRSFNANSDEFFCMFHNEDNYPDIMIFTETWFTENTTVNVPGFEAFHVVRKGSGRGGGVSVFVKNALVSTKIENLCRSDETIEICAVSIVIDACNLTIFGMYRPHSGTVANF